MHGTDFATPLLHACIHTCVVHVLFALSHVSGESNGGIRG